MNINAMTNYELIQQKELKDLKSEGYLLRHKKSGARVLLMENDDENKVFTIGFRTPPEDSTGLPHILEHSVLCGSINQGNRQVNKLHKETSMYVQASTQSLMMRAMQEELTEEEHAVYKRGRNAKSVSPAKNQSITDYRRATGFEALLGYLYLKKEWKRMLDLVKIGLDSLKEKEV